VEELAEIQADRRWRIGMLAARQRRVEVVDESASRTAQRIGLQKL